MDLRALCHDPALATLSWSAATIAAYLCARAVHRRWRRASPPPLVTSSLALLAAAIVLHTSYHEYILATGWLLILLGPATVAFAVPIFEHRALIVRHWAALALGMVAGSLTSMVSAWALATLLGVDEQLRLSLLARSLSTPFAMEVSNTIGGAADLTALFVIATGLVGATLGELMLACLPIRSALALGALLGLGAHGMGTAKAHEVGGEEGTIAGLTMVLTGLLNVLAAPLIGAYARLL